MLLKLSNSGGQVAHETLELHVALREADVAPRNVGAFAVRVRLGDTQRLER